MRIFQAGIQRLGLVLAALAAVPAAPECLAVEADPFRSAAEAAAHLDWASAWESAGHAIERDPRNALAYRLAADVAFRMGRSELALGLFEDLAQRHPENPEAAAAVAVCRRRRGELETAFAASAAARARHPDSRWLIREHLKTARALGRLDGARAILEEQVRARPSSANLLYGLGHAHELAFKFGEAEGWLTKSLRIEPLPETYVSLAEIRMEQARRGECIDLANQGLALIEGRADEAAVRLELLAMRSFCQYLRHEIPDAQDGLTAAMALAREIGDIGGEADALRILARTWDQQPRDAYKMLERATAVHEALGEQRSLAQDLYVLAYADGQINNTSANVPTARRGLAAARLAGDLRGEARLLSVLGPALSDQGRIGEGLHYMFRALEIAESLGIKHNEAANLGNIGNAMMTLGDHEKAWEYGQRSLKLYREMENPASQVLGLRGLGEVCRRRGDDGCALEHHRQALELERQLRAGRLADLLIDVAQDLANLGRLAEAEAAAQEALAIVAAHHKRQAAEVWTAAGELQLRLGRPSEALRLYEAALGQFSGTDDVAAARLRVHRGRAAAHRALNQRGQAIEHYRHAVRLTELLRADAPLSRLRSGFFRDNRGLYVEAVDLLEELYSEDGAAEHRHEAFRLAEAARARVLLETLSGSRAVAQPDLEERRLRHEISRLQGRLMAAALDAHEQPRLRETLRRLEDRLREHEVRSAARAADGAPGVRPQPLDSSEVARELPQDAILVQYLLGSPHSFLFALSREGGLAFHRLPPRETLETLVRVLRSELCERPAVGTAEASLKRARVAGRKLFDALLGPVAGPLAGSRTLVVVPDGLLWYLPFEALVPAKGGRFLVEDLDIAYAPSASLLARDLREPRSRRRWDRSLLAFGDPRGLEAGRPSQTEDNAVIESLERSGFRFANLPSTRREVKAIARVFARETKKVLLGTRFREREVLLELERGGRYIHFASHAVLDETVPGRSGIVVSRDMRPDDGEDGLIQAREIADLRIDAELVTLSACQTGLGAIVDGEGILGLGRAFQEAGARAVVVSLWNVGDASSARLMTRFYRELARGVAPVRSLRMARRSLLRHENPYLRHPYNWAGFVLIGAP